MKIFNTIRNYLCYCGIEKEEFKQVKKDAYISNFRLWKILHCLMIVVFGFLFVNSLMVEMMRANMPFYLGAFIYSLVVACLFLFVLKKESIIAQLIIYLSISLLFLFACFITKNSPNSPATTFMVVLIITPMFMIDKPYFMGIELVCASTVYLVWMYSVKPLDVWKADLINIITYTLVGFFIHVIANSTRIKEFVLTRKINIQKDTDALTGLKNKGAITREINEYLLDESKNQGLMFMLDINYFKKVNDTYGHDIGDSVIKQVGQALNDMFKNNAIVGRFGGDEFVVFIKDTNDLDVAKKLAIKIVNDTSSYIQLPDENDKISVSIGIAAYNGVEKNYSDIFKKADVALYKTKADRTLKYEIYNEQ